MTKTAGNTRWWWSSLQQRTTPVAMSVSSCYCFMMMMMMMAATSTTADATAAANASFWTDHPDRVKILPGYAMGSPPVTILSGYLHYEFENEQVHTHYMLFKAEEAFFAEGEEPPLIYWSNGGPGASSTVGLWTELGPVLLNDDSKTTSAADGTTTISPLYNPHAWTRLGHLLMIDQPAPVGFSYCNDDIYSENCGDIAWTDELTTANAVTALTVLLNQFVELQTIPLYLTGESYAGIYIPTLARALLATDNKLLYEQNLVGFAVGDGCLGTETGICSNIGQETVPSYWDLLFLLGHHQIPIDTYHYVMSECREETTTTDTTTGKIEPEEYRGHVAPAASAIAFSSSQECKDAWKKVSDQVGGMYAYGLYDECTYENGLSSSSPSLLSGGGLNDYSCGGVNVMVEYFSLPAVQAALHVEANFFQTDNAEGAFRYTATEPDLRPFYLDVITNSHLRVLVYNGDADPSINSFMTRDWTSHLPGLVETQEWRPWTIDGCRRMGGYVTRYQGDFDFLTIRGAGHMVPTIKPEAALAFMSAWIHDEDYPIYDGSCTKPAQKTKKQKYHHSDDNERKEEHATVG